MIFETYTVTLTFDEPILGTAPKNPEVYAEYIATKAPTVANGLEETETVPVDPDHEERAGWTGFHEQDGRPFLYDYAVKGFLKESANVLKDQLKITNFRSHVENFCFVKPRRVFFEPASGDHLDVSVNERPLRAMTAKGPRVTVVRSDQLMNAKLTFRLQVLENKKFSEAQIREVLSYGELSGLGQWRNGGWGRFRFEMSGAN